MKHRKRGNAIDISFAKSKTSRAMRVPMHKFPANPALQITEQVEFPATRFDQPTIKPPPTNAPKETRLKQVVPYLPYH